MNIKIDLSKVKKRVAQQTTLDGKIISKRGRKPKPNLVTWHLKISKNSKMKISDFVESEACPFRDASTLINSLVDNFIRDEIPVLEEAHIKNEINS